MAKPTFSVLYDYIHSHSIYMKVGGEQYNLFSQIFRATILKVANGPPEHVPSIGFAKSEKSASDLAPGGLYRLKYRKFFQNERHV